MVSMQRAWIRRPSVHGRLMRALAQGAGGAVSAAVRQASGGSRTMTETRRRRTTEGGAVTFQQDAKTRYVRKRMPRRKRKRWTRFTKKVRHVELQAQPLQIYTTQGVNNSTTAKNQGQVASRILGGTTSSGNDEIYQIFQGAYNIANVAACAPYKIFVKSMVMDYQISNTGSYPVIFDVYTLMCRQTFTTAQDIGAQWLAAIAEVQSPAGGGSMSTTTTAITPFDAPNFCSYWKVLKKTEYIIGSNQVITLQLRNAANRHVEGKELATAPQCLRGSKAFLITWHGAPDNRDAGNAQFAPTTVTLGYQTVVHYAVPPSSTTKEAGKSA